MDMQKWKEWRLRALDEEKNVKDNKEMLSEGKSIIEKLDTAINTLMKKDRFTLDEENFIHELHNYLTNSK